MKIFNHMFQRFSLRRSAGTQSFQHRLYLILFLTIGLSLLAVPLVGYAQGVWGVNYRVGNGTGKGYDITLASDPAGVLYAAQSQGEVLVSRDPPATEMQSWIWSSTNSGRTWSAPVSINHETTLSMTSMAVGSDHAVNIAWMGNFNGNTDHDIFFTRSTDGGKTWSPNLDIIPADSRAPNQVNPVLVIDPRGGQENHMIVAMRTYTVGVEHVYAIHSTDYGNSWSGLVEIPYPDSSVASILKVDSLNMKMDANGVLYLVFDETSTDDTRIFLTRSYDGGANWETVKPITPMGSCSTDPLYLGVARYPSLVISEPGVLYIAFASENGCTQKLRLMFVRSTDGGQNWSLPAIIGPNNLPARVKDRVDQSIALEVLPHQSGVGDDEMILLWTDYGDYPYKNQLRAIQSFDGGVHWGEIQDPSDAPNNDAFNHYALDTVIHQGQVQAVWLDQRVKNWIYPFTASIGEPAVEYRVYVPIVRK
jgi:photosystem II stability/assembly factor-like uncharacterized protein